MLAHAVCCDSVGPQLGFQGGFFFVCLFYSFSQNHHSLSSTIIQIAEKCPLWWSIASCQDAGLGESGMGWISTPQPSGRSLVQ